jgi:uncharacterized protein YcgI (DUF1989 family)
MVDLLPPRYTSSTLETPKSDIISSRQETMTTTVPARQGAHVVLSRGQRLKIINPSGNQVVDTWAFPTTGVPAWMSMAQSRQKLSKLRPGIDDTFIDTQRRPVLTLVEDSSKGVHDMLYPPCDAWRYAEAGVSEHDSCAGTLRKELERFVEGIATGETADGKSNPLIELEKSIRTWGWAPEPLNLFMNVKAEAAAIGKNAGALSVNRPDGNLGDYVVLRAEVDCLVVLSACPNDLLDTNGGKPGPAAYQIL